MQARDLEEDLGPEWGVAVSPCDPDAWSADPYGPADGQARDGNGIVWRRERMQLLDSYTFWLCEQPDAPAARPAWGGSAYQRTCFVATFKDYSSGMKIAFYSAHFDHEGDDKRDTGGSEARRQSSALVMGRALTALRTRKADVVVVLGDFNTFDDRDGATYSSLVSTSEGELNDVRDFPNVLEMDGGRGIASWEGWEHNPWNREAMGTQPRYDQIFVSTNVNVLRTAVSEEKYPVYWHGEHHWVYASDHLPITADLTLPFTKRGRRGGRPRPAPGAADVAPLSSRSNAMLAFLGSLCLAAAALLLYLIWDMAFNQIECRFECRNKLTDPPWPTERNITELCPTASSIPTYEVGSGIGSGGSGESE